LKARLKVAIAPGVFIDESTVTITLYDGELCHFVVPSSAVDRQTGTVYVQVDTVGPVTWALLPTVYGDFVRVRLSDLVCTGDLDRGKEPNAPSLRLIEALRVAAVKAEEVYITAIVDGLELRCRKALGRTARELRHLWLDASGLPVGSRPESGNDNAPSTWRQYDPAFGWSEPGFDTNKCFTWIVDGNEVKA
jgi:hypothetical protein